MRLILPILLLLFTSCFDLSKEEINQLDKSCSETKSISNIVIGFNDFDSTELTNISIYHIAGGKILGSIHLDSKHMYKSGFDI